MISLKSYLNSRSKVLRNSIFDENGIILKIFYQSIYSKNIYNIFTNFLFLIHPIPRVFYRSLFRNKLSNKRIINQKKKYSDKDNIGLISITHAGRSGSYLMSNILDSHSQIISLPPSPCFYEGPIELIKVFQRISFASFYIFKGTKMYQKWWQNFLINFISENYKSLFTFGTNLSEDIGINEGKEKVSKKNLWEFIAFKENVKRLILEFDNIPNPKELTLLIHFAYYETLGIKYKKQEIKYISWQRHRETNFFDTYLLNEYFKNIIFITPIRHPVCSLDSLIYSKQTFKESSNLNEVINLFLKNTNHSYYREVGSQIFIRFEDLHEKSRDVISSLASILKIKKEESLFKTTLNGKPYFFKSGNKLITGFNKNIFNKSVKLKALLEEDILKIEKRCKHIYKEFNYKNFVDSRKSSINFTDINKIKILKRKAKKRILVLGSKVFPDNYGK